MDYVHLSVSNLAWPREHDEEMAEFLIDNGISNVDLVIGRYAESLETLSFSEVARIKKFWNERDIDIIGMQSLMFGPRKFNIFGNYEDRFFATRQLEDMASLASMLGAKKLTFGAPKSRDRGLLSDEDANILASSFFRGVGDWADAEYGVKFCLEPNPVEYGCNFMTTTDEAAEVVRMTESVGVKLQLDVGAVLMNNEDIESIIEKYYYEIGHIHISEPHLGEIRPRPAMAKAIKQAYWYKSVENTVTVEVLWNGDLDMVKRSIITAKQDYTIQ